LQKSRAFTKKNHFVFLNTQFSLAFNVFSPRFGFFTTSPDKNDADGIASRGGVAVYSANNQVDGLKNACVRGML